MEAARSTGSFNRRITVADSNNIVAILDMNAVNSKYQIFEKDYLVEFQSVLEDLKVTVGLMGLAEAPWPEVNALMNESEKMAEIARIRTQGQKIGLGLYSAIGNGPWQYESEVVLQNQGGSETHVPILVPFLSSNETLLMAGGFKLGVRVEPKWNQPLKAGDYLVIKGTWRQVVSFSEIAISTANNITNMQPTSNRIAGEIITFGGSNTPDGWLQCNGSEVAIAAYPRLSQALGTNWGALTNGAGAAGVTHFKLPDLRGRSLIGVGAGAGLTNRAIGQAIGSEVHVITTGEMPSHNHIQDAHNHTQNAHNHIQDAHNHTQNPHSHNYNWFAAPNGVNGLSVAAGSLSAQANIVASVAAVATNNAATATNQVATATNNAVTATNQAVGGGLGHNNMQPSAVVNYLIFAG